MSDKNKKKKRNLKIDEIKVDGVRLGDIKLKKASTCARQILLYFVDFSRWYIPIFDKRRIYRIPFKYYDKFREDDKDRFYHEMYRLRRAGFIKKYFIGKEEFIELLPKGKEQIKTYVAQDVEITAPEKWDRKWRLVIYDIPNDKKTEREILRQKLENLGFLKLQESVYVFPFDCEKIIDLLKNMYFLRSHVQYIVADRIETEIDLIKKFYDRGTLTDRMLNA